MTHIAHIDLNRQIMVIAEIGNNHEGDFNLAQELIYLAAEAGADAVKFQTIIPERLVSPQQPQRLEQLRRFQFTNEQYQALAATAANAGVLFLSTPFDTNSVTLLNSLVPAFKIASGDNNYMPLLRAVARTHKPILLSTGMSDMASIQTAKHFIETIWNENNINPGLILMHCVSAYPVPAEQANLNAISVLKSYNSLTGYSDHTLGINACIAAVALGACVIEKHFTLSKSYSEFRDHALSADPLELTALIQAVRETFLLLGDGKKSIMPVEQSSLHNARRKICAVKTLQSGHVITLDDITWLRATGGMPAGEEKQLLGRTLNTTVQQGEPINLDQI